LSAGLGPVHCCNEWVDGSPGEHDTQRTGNNESNLTFCVAHPASHIGETRVMYVKEKRGNKRDYTTRGVTETRTQHVTM